MTEVAVESSSRRRGQVVLQRRDVHEIEEAEGYQALIARHGYTADEIAAGAAEK